MIAGSLLVRLALAHGGEDHSAAVAPLVSADAERVEVAVSSSLFEAVVRVPRPEGEGPATGVVLIADTETSAPVSEGTASLTLTCAGASEATIQAELHGTASPGIWTFEAEFPREGQCGGVLSVSSGGHADLLAIEGLDLSPPAAAATEHDERPWWLVPALLVGLGIGLLLGTLGGYRAGRRALPAGVLLLTLLPVQGRSHGGEDHGEAAAPAPASGAELRLPLDSQFLLEVRTARAARAPFAERVRAWGQLAPGAGGGATLSAPAGGALQSSGEFPVPGQRVQAGEILATLALAGTERLELAAGAAEANVRLAEARQALALAEQDAARAGQLAGVISARERLAREQAVGVGRESVRQLQQAAGAAGGGAIPIRAPVSGRLAEVSARPGDTVEEGAPLFRIVSDAAALQVQAWAPERTTLGVLPGAAARVAPDALEDAAFEAIVLDPGQVVDPQTGTRPLTLQLAAADARLVPGMAVTAWVARGAARDALVIPEAAVVDSNGQSIVFVKTGPETFALRPVRLGASDGDVREVRAGLQPGERVVVQGTYTLRSLAGR